MLRIDSKYGKEKERKKGAPYLFDLGIVRQYIAPLLQLFSEEQYSPHLVSILMKLRYI
jgi:hypothetical protein